MIVVDANTGQVVQEGVPFRNVHGLNKILKVQPGLLNADALVMVGPYAARWVRLKVRWTHPAFFGRHVAFLDS